MEKTSLSKRKKVKHIKTYRFFNTLLRFTLGKFIAARYNVRAENQEIFRNISAPYMVLPNHMTFWDPFITSSFIPDPVYYVTSDANFRSPVLKFLLGLVGSIPKTKLMSDYETIRHIMRVRDKKGVIGIFPEGRRTWDGHTLEILYPTAKLIRLLKIPVIVPIFQGAYLSLPRWTKRHRKGEVIVDFKLAFTAEEAASLSVDEIYRKLTDLLEYDEYEYQKEHMTAFRGKRIAENLELTLFTCPACRSFGTMYSHGRDFSCTSCGYAVKYTEYGFFERSADSPSDDSILLTIRDWNVWQQEYLAEYLKKQSEKGSGTALIRDEKIWLMTGYKSNPLKKIHFGEMTLYPDRLEFLPLSKEKLIFPLQEVAGMNVQNNEKLEFYYKNVMYRVNFTSRRISSYKWLSAVSLRKESVKAEKELPQGVM